MQLTWLIGAPGRLASVHQLVVGRIGLGSPATQLMRAVRRSLLNMTSLPQRRVVLLVLFATVAMAMLWLSFSSGSLSPRAVGTEDATHVQALREMAHIRQEGLGQVFTFTVNSRFTVFLDDDLYPFSEWECLPDGVIGFSSLYAAGRAYGTWPAAYDTIRVGRCEFRDRDFAAEIVIVDYVPSSTPSLP